jgi:sugar lactone lactonase YvrE
MIWQPVVASIYGLAESPFWHPQERCLYWVDIAGKQVLRFDPHTSNLQAWDMPSEPGCIAPVAGGGLVIALRNGIFRARTWGGPLELVTVLDYDPATVRANDGKCDPLGRLWVGTYDETKRARLAALYSVDCRGGCIPRVEQKASDALTGNGLGWSPDATTLYWADTSSNVIHVWDYDLQANILTADRIFQSFDPKPPGWSFEQTGYGGRPDGAAVDSEGNYFVAMYEGRRVCQFSPEGALLRQIVTPAQCPTMVCFGGEDLKTLYLTTARHGRSSAELAHYPRSGGVFSVPVSIAGLPVNFFVE